MTGIVLPPPPRDSGWESDDLDKYDLPDHIELIYGALELMMSPQRAWHSEVLFRLRRILDGKAPEDLQIHQRMTVRIDRKSRPEPDLLTVEDRPEYGRDTRWFHPAHVRLVAEVESPESEQRDRYLKPGIYARSGIPYYLRVSEAAEGLPVLHLYRLEGNEYKLVREEYGRVIIVEPFEVNAKLEGRW